MGLSVGCASRVVYVRSAPPAVRVEVAGPPPFAAAVWIPGHWEWHGSWVWFPGHWAKAPRGKVWVPGYWQQTPRGWRWVKGHWARR
ncbi:MAG: hypothetical protein ONB30_07785 [candidate division KSB1 bacterium]|nr:hypothetical protein [candidate division KSB1 bacterium]